ncbi:MAG: hypothetical protein RLZZ436_1015, partial [Planctomycetota bacterium]
STLCSPGGSISLPPRRRNPERMDGSPRLRFASWCGRCLRHQQRVAMNFTRGLPPCGSCVLTSHFSLLTSHFSLLTSSLASPLHFLRSPLSRSALCPPAPAKWPRLSVVSDVLEHPVSIHTLRFEHKRRAVAVNRPVEPRYAPGDTLAARVCAVIRESTSRDRLSCFLAVIERTSRPLDSRPAAHRVGQ